MRIVAGAYRGKQIAAPRGDAIRPTSDRLRETIFNILAHAHGDPVEEARVVDLFAGTGALGLEALSRGARFALFVDDSVGARGLIRANIETLGLGGRTRLFRRDATRLGPIGPIEPFTLAFVDPPYRRGLAVPALRGLAEGGWLKPGAICVVEEAVDGPFEVPDGFEAIDERDYAETRLRFLRRSGPADGGG